MAEIKQYTRQALPQQMVGAQASPDAFGGNTTGLQAQANSLQDSAQAADGVAEQVNTVSKRIQTREETINRIRDEDKFYQEAFADFNATMSEQDLTDPNVARDFNAKIREKANKYISEHRGSEESRVQLENDLLNRATQFSTQMTSNSLSAQRGFVMSKAGDKINELAKMARDNPSSLGDVYRQADKIIGDLSPALYSEDEIALADAAHQQITLSAITSYTDAGNYKEAKTLIDENPMFLTALEPEAQRRIVEEISGGLRKEKEIIDKTRNQVTAVKVAAAELGVDVSQSNIFSAVTGIEQKDSPASKVEEFERITGAKATPSVIAKIGFGVDLGSGEIDYNKDYTNVNGEAVLTPKGIQTKVKEPFDSAAASKMFKSKVDGAIALFRENGNKQALLSAMITFQKALDEGAIVREGDIVLQRQAQGLSDKISLLVKPGQIIGDELVDEMEATMNDFTAKALQSYKSVIDPLLQEGDRLGYRRINTIPKESYDAVFGGIPSSPSDKKTSEADSTTITADEFLQQ